MRILAVLTLVCLAACSGDPRAYGITGPAAPARPVQADDATVDMPGLPQGNSVYGPSMRPSTGSGGYWGYN